ncbi:MAG: hypothetical protein E7253_06500 [Lachnospiraceae bacterium]|nr:hypothetical protein [Lachnospiraceae bacterium]
MLNILLGILKIIGILLAVILSLILIFILIVLFGPIGYKASGTYREEKKGSAAISWLGFVLRAKADYKKDNNKDDNKEAGLLWTVRLFGILVASNEERFLLKKEEKRRMQEEKRRVKEERQNSEERQINDEKEFQSSGLEKGQPAKTQVTEAVADNGKDTDRNSAPQVPEKTENQEVKGKEDKVSKVKIKLNHLMQKIKSIPDRIKSFITGLKTKIESIKEKMRRILEIKEFFLGEQNREGYLHVLRNLKKMILHMLPRKLKGTIEFGVEDPYIMGQILTVLGIFYPVYQDKFTVLPDFENPGFAGEVSLKGRIIPGYLILRLLIAICNREVIRIIKEGRVLIGGNKS